MQYANLRKNRLPHMDHHRAASEINVNIKKEKHMLSYPQCVYNYYGMLFQ